VRDVTGEPVEGGDLAPQMRAWPVETDPTAFGDETNFGNGARCGVVEGEEAATWFEELSTSNQLTRWEHEGLDARFTVVARPLLPHEEPACPEEFLAP
jgi:hypothetical protein